MIGVCCPVWCEDRYLGLVLEQMALCPGPKVVLWQDQPLYWLGAGPAPSGWNSNVRQVLEKFPDIDVVMIDQAAQGAVDAEYGGFLCLAKFGVEYLADRGSTRFVWLESDWLFELSQAEQLYAFVEACTTPLVGVKARHYWRDFNHVMSKGDVTISRPVSDAALLNHYEETDITRLDLMMHHPAYVMSDAEMYRKIHSWGHAPLFKERRFYECEWIGHDDSVVRPEPIDFELPTNINERLHKWGAVL